MRLPPFSLRRLAFALAAGLALTAFAAAASARTETVRWEHADTSTVAGFRILMGTTPTNLNQSIDVGLPTASGGVFSHQFNVADGDTVFIAITAYGPTGLESTGSNLGYLPAPLGAPGRPQLAGN